MNCVRANDLGCGDDARNVEIRIAGGGGADADIVVGEANVKRLAIRFRVDRNGLHAELAAGANHPQSDLAAVGDENLLKHVVPKFSL
jgi:hypothetical protein